MIIAQLAAAKKKVPPKFWRVLQVPSVDVRWAGRICRYVEREHEGGRTYVTVEWVNGERIMLQKTAEVVPAGLHDRLAYLDKFDEWEKITGAEAQFKRDRDWENQHITRGEIVEATGAPYHSWKNSTRVRTLATELESWSDGVPAWLGAWPPEGDGTREDDYVHGRLIFSPRAWENKVNWYRATVVSTAVDIGKPFTVRYHDNQPVADAREFSPVGMTSAVGWYDIRRLEPTQPEEKEDE